MASQFDEVTTQAGLEQVLARSERAPVLLYLHDPHCWLSSMAHAEVSDLGLPVAWIDVHACHDLGMEVERITGVRHQSPQALVIRDRQATWSASHGRVTTTSILAALGTAEEPVVNGPQPRTGKRRALRSALSGLRRRSL